MTSAFRKKMQPDKGSGARFRFNLVESALYSAGMTVSESYAVAVSNFEKGCYRSMIPATWEIPSLEAT